VAATRLGAADCAAAEGAARAVAACVERYGRPPDALAHCAGPVLAPLQRGGQSGLGRLPEAAGVDGDQ
jgi:hypothetical protein